MPTDEDMQQQRDIGKIWGAIEKQGGDIKELRTALIGIDGKNGLRSELRDFIIEMRKRMDNQDEAIEEINNQGSDKISHVEKEIERVDRDVKAGIAWGKNLWEHERHLPGMCIGKKALDEYRCAIEEDEMKLQTALEQRAIKEREFTTSLQTTRSTVIGGVIVAFITIGLPSIISLAREILLARGTL